MESRDAPQSLVLRPIISSEDGGDYANMSYDGTNASYIFCSNTSFVVILKSGKIVVSGRNILGAAELPASTTEVYPLSDVTITEEYDGTNAIDKRPLKINLIADLSCNNINLLGDISGNDAILIIYNF